MNQENRTVTSPAKITLEMHNAITTWEGPWDSDFMKLIEAFCGLCSTVGFADKSKLLKCIYEDIQDDIYLEEQYDKKNLEV